MAGEIYLAAAILLDVVFLFAAVVAALWRTDSTMRQAFLVSIVYLPILLGVMVLDRTML